MFARAKGKAPRLAALLAVAALLLCACGDARYASDAPQSVTLTVMGRKSDMEKRYLTAIFERYERATGNQLEIVAYEDAEFEEDAAAQFAAGNIPDVFMHFNNADLNRFNPDENFALLGDESWVNDLTAGARAYCENAEGELIGLPFWESSVSGCYYNKTLFDSLGLKPASTQAEFDMLCQVFADLGYTPLLWPANGCTWMYQFGLDPIFADDLALLERLNAGEIDYADIPAVTAMAEWIAGAAEKGWFGPDYLRSGWSDIGPMLSSGEAVMTFIWDTWFYTDFEPDGKYTLDDFALMPVFMNTCEDGTYEGGNLNMMMVNKNGAHVSDALAFLAFCATKENYNAAFEGISTVNCFKGQTTNIQSKMVTDAGASIAARERVSTAATKIIGYSAEDVAAAFDQLFRGRTDISGCVRLMDEYRLEDARKQGADASEAQSGGQNAR